MVSKKIKMIFLISISIFITYLILLIQNYSEIPELITTHIDIKGQTDDQGGKNNLWIASSVNLGLLLIIGFLVQKPHLANFPVEITEKNKDIAYKNMQIFLSILSVIISCAFAYMIFKAINYTHNYFYIMSTLILFPLTILFFIKKKDD
jgi:uncharacterized membrane protein